MKRLAFNLACGLSLCVCALAIVLWLRSYYYCDVIIHQHGPADRVGMTSESGRLVFEFEARQTAAISPGWVYFDKPFPRRWRRPGKLLGFDVYRATARHFLLLPRTPLWGITVPHLFVILLSAGLPARWIARRDRIALVRRRLAGGLCQACGYDLRASAERCPECGLPQLTP